MVEGQPPNQLPRAAEIFTDQQAHDRAWAQLEFACERVMQLPRSVCGHIVLNRDMWPPRLAVLPRERPHRSTRCRPQPVELWRPDPEGDAKARHEGRVEKDGYGSSRKPTFKQFVCADVRKSVR